ncbi:MAG: DNA polymerase IV [Deltaproteobacteria bacterium]|nr:DNA polymerase IV [Deltaproteobacteria bacterium]
MSDGPISDGPISDRASPRVTGRDAIAPARLCCLDLDTFFVSVERLFDPSLRGKPVVVGGQPGTRGVVVAASYEVRRFGVRSGMSLVEAGRLAPQAIYLSRRQGSYGEYSRRVRELVDTFCPAVQAASIDEFYLDFSGCERLYHSAADRSDDAAIERTVRQLTAAIDQQLGLPASAGIGRTKAVAKIACRLAKPHGVLFVAAGGERALLDPLPVRALPGIGPVAERRLTNAGVARLGQLAELPLSTLTPLLGSAAAALQRAARGEGRTALGRDRPAFREYDAEGETIGSISNERTFAADIDDHRAVSQVLCQLTERVCWRARRRGVQARTLTVKVKHADFSLTSRSQSIETPSDSELQWLPIARRLLVAARDPQRAVRLVGVGVSALSPAQQQLSLFDGPGRKLHQAVDEARSKFGFEAVRLGDGQGEGLAPLLRERS